MSLTHKVLKTAGKYSLCEMSVLDAGALRRVVGYRLLNRNTDIVGIFETEAQGMEALNRLAFPWRGVIPRI